ncbi:cytochrome P450 6k1-like [Chrysoperla carnea]|uniref:cytochrome P450 6k1-like n=1 Tax=Chrysoperla carnea TaxID=189513 RepID=UPI001D05C8DE|nr:cytochrome P450 6k1-like [Chrysoperla carnea]
MRMRLITSSLSFDLLTLLLIGIILFYNYLKSKYNYWKERNVPYEEPNLIFGNFYDAFTFKRQITSFFHDQYRKTNDKVFGLYVFQRPFLLLRDPELIKHVLVKDFNNFIPRSNSKSSNDPIGNKNLFSLKNVHHWRFMRSKMSPFFSSGKMRNVFGLLDTIGDQLTEHIKKHLNETIDIKDVSQKYTIDVIVSAAYGIEANSFTNEKAAFSSIGKVIFTYSLKRSVELISYFFAPLLVKLFNFKFFGDEATQFFRSVFWTAIKERELNYVKRPDLIEALIALKNKGTLEDSPAVGDLGTMNNSKKLSSNKDTIKLEGDILVAQAAVFFAAGFETSSLAISFTLYFLSYNPEIQIKLRKEIQTVIARNGGKFTYDCLQDMKFLEACIKETLRMYPTLGFLDREAIDTYTFPGTNITIDKGTAVVISLEGLHRDSQYFENPDVYDPERFNENNKINIVPFTFMPFGEGPRNCIGARFGKISTKIGLVHILKDFELETTKNPEPVIIDKRAVFLSPKGGINLKFRTGTVYVQ